MERKVDEINWLQGESCCWSAITPRSWDRNWWVWKRKLWLGNKCCGNFINDLKLIFFVERCWNWGGIWLRNRFLRNALKMRNEWFWTEIKTWSFWLRYWFNIVLNDNIIVYIDNKFNINIWISFHVQSWWSFQQAPFFHLFKHEKPSKLYYLNWIKRSESLFETQFSSVHCTSHTFEVA